MQLRGGHRPSGLCRLCGCCRYTLCVGGRASSNRPRPCVLVGLMPRQRLQRLQRHLLRQPIRHLLRQRRQSRARPYLHDQWWQAGRPHAARGIGRSRQRQDDEHRQMHQQRARDCNAKRAAAVDVGMQRPCHARGYGPEPAKPIGSTALELKACTAATVTPERQQISNPTRDSPLVITSLMHAAQRLRLMPAAHASCSCTLLVHARSCLLNMHAARACRSRTTRGWSSRPRAGYLFRRHRF